MFRNVLFEFEDLPWFPNGIRESMTDYLRYLLTGLNFYQPIYPLLLEMLDKTKSNQIVDLCSGGGGAIEQVKRNLDKILGQNIQVTLTDKFPNISAFTWIEHHSNLQIAFSGIPVDATDVPSHLKGVRTIFSGFHHFDPQLGARILKNAVDQRAAIGIFDGGDKNILTILGMLLFHPIAFLLFTPFFRPFRLSRLLFTYLIPIIPFCTIWDGIVSITRLYSPEELLQMADSVEKNNYTWKAGYARNRWGMHVTYLIGYPSNTKDQPQTQAV